MLLGGCGSPLALPGVTSTLYFGVPVGETLGDLLDDPDDFSPSYSTS